MTILRFSILSLCVCIGSIHSMESEVEKEKLLELQESIVIKETKKTDDFDNTCAQLTKEQILQAQIKKRKLSNLIHGLATLGMIGVDLANSYWDEKGLLEQHQIKGGYIGGSCECPNQTAYCTLKSELYFGQDCEQTINSKFLYAINDGITMSRLYMGLANLYHIYQVQQALNEQRVTERTKTISFGWSWAQGLNGGLIGGIGSLTGIITGIKNFPRTIGVWGLNMMLDAFGSFNWTQNEAACEEILAFVAHMEEVGIAAEKEEENTIFADETSDDTSDDTLENKTDNETSSDDDDYERIPQ
jgi:hypothetical protein